jgi:hypothetical protein
MDSQITTQVIIISFIIFNIISTMTKQYFFSILGLLALLFAACQQAPKPATEEELSQMNRDFVKALNAKDAVAAANCYTELLRREPNGKWLSTMGMWNTDTLALK